MPRPARIAPLAASACALLTTAPLHAAFVSPQSWTRAADGTTYQAWDTFAATTDAAPDVAGSTNPSGTARLTENTGQAFVTGGGNIYSFAAATNFTVTVPEADVPTPPHHVTAIVQLRTQGSELDYDSILLNGQAPVDSAELDRDTLGGFGGALVDSWHLFNLDYADFGDGVPGVKNLTLSFAAADSSMSLDRLAIDTAVRPFGFYDEPNPVPEPAGLALLGVAGPLALGRRRSA